MAFKMKGFSYPGKSPAKLNPYYRIDDAGKRHEIGFEEFKERSNRLESVEATGQERIDLWGARVRGGKTGIHEIDATSRDDARSEYNKAVEANTMDKLSQGSKKKKKKKKKNIFGNIKGTQHIKGR
jgi:hypothetical protein